MSRSVYHTLILNIESASIFFSLGKMIGMVRKRGKKKEQKKLHYVMPLTFQSNFNEFIKIKYNVLYCIVLYCIVLYCIVLLCYIILLLM